MWVIFLPVNVNRSKDFASTFKHETLMERECLQSARRLSQDNMTERIIVSPFSVFVMSKYYIGLHSYSTLHEKNGGSVLTMKMVVNISIQ